MMIFPRNPAETFVRKASRNLQFVFSENSCRSQNLKMEKNTIMMNNKNSDY